jgi:hypothetical protein
LLTNKNGVTRRGRTPTNRGRPGTKCHLITDGRGIPFAFTLTGANVHDSVPFEELPDDPAGRRQARPTATRTRQAYADKAYDQRRCPRACQRRQIKSRIASSSIETSQKLGRHRWVIERSFAWFNNKFRRLTIRYERRLDHRLRAHSSACNWVRCPLGREALRVQVSKKTEPFRQFLKFSAWRRALKAICSACGCIFERLLDHHIRPGVRERVDAGSERTASTSV